MEDQIALSDLLVPYSRILSRVLILEEPVTISPGQGSAMVSSSRGALIVPQPKRRDTVWAARMAVRPFMPIGTEVQALLDAALGAAPTDVPVLRGPLSSRVVLEALAFLQTVGVGPGYVEVSRDAELGDLDLSPFSSLDLGLTFPRGVSAFFLGNPLGSLFCDREQCSYAVPSTRRFVLVRDPQTDDPR